MHWCKAVMRAVDRSCEVRPRTTADWPAVVGAQAAELLRKRRDDTPLRLLTSREMPTLSGKFTSRGTIWPRR